MIEDPPLLKVRRKFARPDTKTVAAFQGVMTGHLVDALGGTGALDWRIKPLALQNSEFVGVALPCYAGPADNLAVFGALEAAQPGDVLLAASEEHMGCAVVGDLVIGMMRNRGITAFVTDGLIRDIEGILPVGLPVFCRGITPNSPVRNGPGTVGLPVILGGQQVCAGDLVVGDRNGVVVVPYNKIEDTLKQLEQIRKTEAEMEAAVQGGLIIPGFFQTVLDSGRIQEIK
jgi:4-hydroxy-4-methyl-2-oxoglutarate aldolase